MTIYGLNFNGTKIPEGIKRKFSLRVSIEKSAKGRTTKWAWLQGVAQSPQERDQMLLQAQRPGRIIQVAERRTAAGMWYGIYIY